MKGVVKYLKKYTFLIILAITFVVIQAILNLYLPDLMGDIVNKGVSRGNVDYILSVGWKMLFVTLLNVAAAIVSTYFAAKVAMGFGKDLRSHGSILILLVEITSPDSEILIILLSEYKVKVL
ncbi:hypothetical protein [Petrotoga halophila]|uniref:ABC transmembrane type-1 domain-containing protein n=1 Tax=Petrotoga halophila DSM 16923 TaxID=1122953 RepID=A0A2S5EH37_9BACT|nr:hypothetical protein [Petrotoga halophila]POZ92299.1 hypothetical protein AA81_08025 [Petrotoga halophila DSM 16923]